MQLTTTHGADSALFIRYTCMQLKAVPSQQLGASSLCEALLWVFADIVSEMYKFISLVIWALFFVVCAMLERRPSSIQSPHLCKWVGECCSAGKPRVHAPCLANIHSALESWSTEHWTPAGINKVWHYWMCHLPICFVEEDVKRWQCLCH